MVKTYTGRQEEAARRFRIDAAKMAVRGYYPVSQSYQAGEWGCGAFVIALLLCIVIVGLFIFIYMLIVKPPGTLSVVYEYRNRETDAQDVSESKVCPACAETVKARARICRFCGNNLVSDDDSKS